MKRYKKYITPYKGAFICGPILMLTEVAGEIALPKLMSMIINNGVANRDTGYIIRVGIFMFATALIMAAGGGSRLFCSQGVHFLYYGFKKGCVCQGAAVFF